MKKHARRKLSEARVSCLNRKLLFKQGDPTWEQPVQKCYLDEHGRAVQIDVYNWKQEIRFK